MLSSGFVGTTLTCTLPTPNQNLSECYWGAILEKKKKLAPLKDHSFPEAPWSCSKGCFLSVTLAVPICKATEGRVLDKHKVHSAML